MRHSPLLLALALLLVTAPAHADPPAAAPAVEEVDAALFAAERSGRMLMNLLDDSRRSRRVRDVACVDGALSQVNSFARSLGERRARVVEAARRGDQRELALQRRVIRALVQQLEERTRAGRACVYGEMPEGRGRHVTVVTVLVDPAVPSHDDLAPLASAEPGRPFVRHE